MDFPDKRVIQKLMTHKLVFVLKISFDSGSTKKSTFCLLYKSRDLCEDSSNALNQCIVIPC